jgi:glycine cleavage system H lipoate-binding protein
MTCPFLRESQVKFCRTAAVRKLIPLALAGKTDEKCGSPEHTGCAVYRAHAAEEDGAAGSQSCPYLRESLMQYCGAAPVARFVPYSESLISRCGNDGHRYCELYLGMAHPSLDNEQVEGITMPGWLRYSANHMWLDVTEDGVCHAGIDAFLSRALGKVERISYVWQKGPRRPAAVLTVNGMDLEVVFPNQMTITACNLYLRADPGRLAAEPYTGAWLFEGTPLPETVNGLFEGPAAREWMEREQHRMNDFLQQQTGVSADGGTLTRGLLRALEREQALALYHEFVHL